MNSTLTAIFILLCTASTLGHLGAFLGDIFNLWRVAPMMSAGPRKLIRAGMVACGGGSIVFIVMIAIDRWVQVGLPEIVAQLGIALYGTGSLWGAIQRGMAVDPEPERSQTRRPTPAPATANGAWAPPLMPVGRPHRHHHSPPRHQRH